jgi:putative spermidine/putrescine transport system permease protein
LDSISNMFKKLSPEKLLLVPLILFLGFFEIYPILKIAYISILNSAGKITFENYIKIAENHAFIISIRNSIFFSIAVTLVGGIGGTFVGYITPKLPGNIKKMLLSLYSIPNSLSGLVVAFSFIILLGRNGVINLIIQRIFGLSRDTYFNLYSWFGLIVVYAFFMIPLMTLTMAAVFENLDPTIMEAARNLGARPWQVWKYVVIPAMAPGLLAGLSIQLAAMLGAFGTVLALVGASKGLLSTEIYFQTSEATYNLAQADALAIILIILISVGLIGLRSLERRFRR